jgi:hypothetical protein
MQDQNISDLITGRSFTDAEAAALEEQAIAAHTQNKSKLLEGSRNQEEKYYNYYERFINDSELDLLMRLSSIDLDDRKRIFLATLSDAGRSLKDDRFVIWTLSSLRSEDKRLAQATAIFLLTCCGEKGQKALECMLQIFELPQHKLIEGIVQLLS